MSPRIPLLTSLFLLLSSTSLATAKTSLETEPPLLPAARFVAGEAVESASASALQRPALPPGAKAAEIDADLAAQLALARARWELSRDDLVVGSVVPLVGPDDEVVAWGVDFRLDGASDAAKADLSGADAFEAELQSARFHSVTVSATWDAPPIRAPRAGVTNFYAAAPRMVSIAGELLQSTDPHLERVYPLSSWARDYEFRVSGQSIVIEGQEPWRWWNANDYRLAKRAHAEWRRERARTVQLAKGQDPEGALLSGRAKNEALADAWLSGAVAPKAVGWIDDSSAFEPFFWYGGCSPTAG